MRATLISGVRASCHVRDFCFLMEYYSLSMSCFCIGVPTDSPSRGGDVAVDVFDISQSGLPAPLYSVLVSVSVLWSFQLYFIP